MSVIALGLAALAPSLAGAAVREDLRVCQNGYFKTLTKGATPRPTNREDQYCLGLGYWFQPSPLPRDPARSAQWHAAAADQGHPAAMVALAYMLEKGHGVAPDPGKAFQLYERAAALGSADAMFNLFRAYTTGKLVKADPGKARAWLDKAAAAGNVEAKKELAVIARGAREAPGRDLVTAAYAAYQKKDYATSARLYREAADLGNADAAAVLGQHYMQGLGVTKDLKEAARLYQIAAEKGSPNGQAQLGFAYEHGEGVPENWAEMRRWCEKSAAQHHPLGLNCVGRLYMFGMAVPMDRAKAIAWFDRASDQDNPYARWFAIYLRKPSNCTGFRSEWEREKFFGVCIDPKGIIFNTSKERTVWLAKRYGELEAEALRNWGSDAGASSCRAAGGSWSGSGCYTPAGRPLDPQSGRCYPC